MKNFSAVKDLLEGSTLRTPPGGPEGGSWGEGDWRFLSWLLELIGKLAMAPHYPSAQADAELQPCHKSEKHYAWIHANGHSAKQSLNHTPKQLFHEHLKQI